MSGLVFSHAEAAFQEMTDPARIREHPGLRELEVLQTSHQGPGGPGSMRRVVLPIGEYTEQVLAWDPPHRVEYDVVAESAPIDHHGGTLSFTPDPRGVTVQWTSSFTLLAGPLRGPVALWMARRVADDLAWHLEVVAATVQGQPAPRRHGFHLAWVLVPLALWNVALAGRLPGAIGTDDGLPLGLLLAEGAVRVACVAAILPARVHRHAPTAAHVALWLGVVVYLASWLPLLFAPALAGSPVFAVAPAVTPALFLGPMAWLARSRPIGALGAAFVFLHVVHQLWP